MPSGAASRAGRSTASDSWDSGCIPRRTPVDWPFDPAEPAASPPTIDNMTERRTLLAAGDVFDSLTEAECRTLLATRTFGRVGVTSGGLPVIMPVRYLFSENAITFRTGGGTKLRAAESADLLALHV